MSNSVAYCMKYPKNPDFTPTKAEREDLGEFMTRHARLVGAYGADKPSQAMVIAQQCREIGTIHTGVAHHDRSYELAVAMALAL